MLRILILNYEFPPMGGGAGHASFQIASSLAKRGHRVDVVTSRVGSQRRWERKGRLAVFRVRSFRRGIQDCGINGAWSYLFFAAPVIEHLTRKRRYDIVHCFFSLPTGLLSLCVPGLRRLPAVISLRGSDVPGYDAEHRLLQRMHRCMLPLTRRIWQRSGAVVALSDSLRRLAHQTLPGAPIGVIPNGICADFRPNAWPKQARSAGEPLQILTVARLVKRKGLDSLLRAVALLSDLSIRLLIQGSGSDEKSLRELAATLGIEDRVTFLGFRERESLPPVYQNADIFIMPSHSESFGLAVLEAMACGLPVIVSRVGGMVDYVEEGVNGLIVPPNDAMRLAEAIRHLAEAPEICRAMGARNNQKAHAEYTWERTTQAYLETYRSVLERHERSAHAGH